MQSLYCIDWIRPWLRFWEFILYLYFFSMIVSHLYLYLHFINWKRPWPWVWEFPSDWFLQWSGPTNTAAEGRASLVKITLPCSYRWYSLNDTFLSFFIIFLLIWKWYYPLFINTNNDTLWMLHLYLSLHSSICICICIPPCFNLFPTRLLRQRSNFIYERALISRRADSLQLIHNSIWRWHRSVFALQMYDSVDLICCAFISLQEVDLSD